VQNDKAGQEYWQEVWEYKDRIEPIDPSYYTYRKIDWLFRRYLPDGKGKSLMEIGAAFSSYLPYFHNRFGYWVWGIDYEKGSAWRTEEIYRSMGMDIPIMHRDFFSDAPIERSDIVTSFGVFEHFEHLDESIRHTRLYLNDGGIIVTVIPNMNGLVGWLQKHFAPAVYAVHIPYTASDLKAAHEAAGYETLFCDYFGTYQGGVVNLDGHPRAAFWQKVLAVPGKPMDWISRLLSRRLDSRLYSPYVIYIGRAR